MSISEKQKMNIWQCKSKQKDSISNNKHSIIQFLLIKRSQIADYHSKFQSLLSNQQAFN